MERADPKGQTIMKPKTIITILLLTFVLGSVIFLIAGESLKGKTPAIPTNRGTNTDADPSPALQTKKAEEPSRQSSRTIIAYYFHGRARCRSCILIESYTKEAIYRDFEKELKQLCNKYNIPYYVNTWRGDNCVTIWRKNSGK